MDAAQAFSTVIPVETTRNVSPHALFDWDLNLVSKEFVCDFTSLNQLLKPNNIIKNYSDVINLMTVRYQNKLKQAMKSAMHSGEGQFVSCCLSTENGTLTYAEIYMELGSPNCLKGTIRPLFAFTSSNEIANIFGAIFESSQYGIVVTDKDTRIIACNQYYEKQSGYECSSLLGLRTSIFNAGKHSNQFYKKMWTALNEQGSWSGVMLAKNNVGAVYPQNMTIQRVEPSEGKVYYVALTTNLSESLSSIAEKNLGGIDLLTQLPTKERVLSQLEALLESKEQDTGILVLGIKPQFDQEWIFDDQKIFSDILSHNRGSRITGYAGSGTYIACIEFVISDQKQFVQSLNNAVRYYFLGLKTVASERLYAAISRGQVGASILDVDAQKPARLLSHAVQAMIGAKEFGGKSINYFHSNTHKEMVKKQQLEIIVQNAIKKHQLNVHYQPIVHAQTGKVMMFEALCRFPCVDGESFNTQVMVEIAEELGLVVDLDRSIAMKALSDHDELRRIFGEDVGLTLNCSLRTKDSTQKALVETAKLVCANTERPDLITIELTESGQFFSKQEQDCAVERIRELGLSVAIDDFGSGYSSISYLSESKFNKLKIDRELIIDIHESTCKQNIIEMVTKLAHTLDVEVVAEGIEKPEELRIMQLANVDYIQGYLFDKPRALNELLELYGAQEGIGPFEEMAKTQVDTKSILSLFRNAPPKMSPGDPLSLAVQHLKRDGVKMLPVTVDSKCVGLLDQQMVNLHMTPSMGTDLESAKEAKIWSKPINQIMSVDFSVINIDRTLDEIPRLIEEGVKFPWVLINDSEHYKGMLNESDLLKYCLPWSG